MLPLLCLLILPLFIDASPELLAKNYRFNFSTFNQQKYIEGIMTVSLNDQVDMLGFACKTFFCRLQEDTKCIAQCKDFAKLNVTVDEKLVDTLVTADFPKPTTSEADCNNRFTTLFHMTYDFSPLCKFHYKCEKHELYEKEFSQFGSVVRSHLPFFRDQETFKKQLDDLKTGNKTEPEKKTKVSWKKKLLNHAKKILNSSKNQTIPEYLFDV